MESFISHAAPAKFIKGVARIAGRAMILWAGANSCRDVDISARRPRPRKNHPL